MSVGKGSNTTTQTSAPNPAAASAYTTLLNQAQGVAATPYNPYSGELVAPVNAQQTAGINNINANANYAQPYIQQAAGFANQAAQPLTAAQIQQYQNPFTSQVVNATQQQFNNQNAQQQQQVLGNAVAQGALGGDRVGVAQANLAGQQQTAEAPVIAGLESQGYTTGLQTALTEQSNLGNAAYSLGNLGVAGQNAALTGANAQVGAGSLQQGTQQALDTAQQQQYYMAQAYPFQTSQWLAGIDTGLGSQLGGTSTTTGPAPNPLAQIAGLGLVAAGTYFGGPAGGAAAGQVAQSTGVYRGGRIRGFDAGGGVNPYGAPMFGGVTGWVPTLQITGGHGAPQGGGGGGQQQPQAGFSPQSMQGDIKGIEGLSSGLSNLSAGYNTNGSMSGAQWAAAGQGEGPYAALGAPEEAYTGFAPDENRGGRINGFRLGGPVARARRSAIFVPRAGFGTGGIIPHYADGGDADVIDATDLPPINVGSGGLGLGADWQPSNPALDADAGYGADGSLAYAPVAGVSSRGLPPVMTRGASTSGVDDPDSAYNRSLLAPSAAPDPTAAASAPDAAASPQGGFGLANFGLSPAAKQGLLAAGFGMMASRSPFLGTAIGEGGLQGLSAYSGEQKQELAAKKTQADIDREKEIVNHGAKQLEQEAQFHQDQYSKLTAAQQATQEHEKQDYELRLQQFKNTQMQPVKIGTDASMRDIYGLRDPATGKITPLDPATGMPQQSAPVAPSAPASQPGAPGNDQSAIPASAQPVSAQTERDEDYLKTLPPDVQNKIHALVDYDLNPQTIPMRQRDAMLNYAFKYDPNYQPVMYPARAQAIKEFTAGGPNSPIGQITAGNTAIQHAGEMSDAVEKMKAIPGMLSSVGASGVPFVSYWAGKLNNASVAGTPEGQALAEFNTARNHFSEEVTKFYSGVGGSEAERDRALSNLDAAKSLPELRAAIAQEATLMQGKVNALQDRWKNAVGGVSGWQSALKRAGVPDYPIFAQQSQDAVNRIQQRRNADSASIPAPAQRQTGQVYQTPKGPARWTGSGWQLQQ